MAELFSPIVLLFIIIFAGLCLGKFRICGVSLDVSAVLLVSLLFGVIAQTVGSFTVGEVKMYLYNDSQKSIYGFLSSLGTSLFISTVGIDAGISFAKCNNRFKWRAFLSGALVVLIGAVSSVIFFLTDDYLSNAMLMGIFAGSMTSTPALSSACELCIDNSSVVAGYGMSYCCGLLSVVIFVQLMAKKQLGTILEKGIEEKSRTYKNTGEINVLFLICGLIPLGYVLKQILPFGATGGILFISVLLGIIIAKKGFKISRYDNFRDLGLVLFFVGSGVPAGATVREGFSFKWLVYGLCVSVIAITVGYLSAKKIYGFSKVQTLSVICGGMTSTPAIGALKNICKNVDLSLYVMSYAGALIMLLISVRCLFCLIQ